MLCRAFCCSMLYSNNAKDNADRFFKYDNDEIAITRKLYRSGDSEYMINRTPCRLKDIIETLHDSGIGKNGRGIIDATEMVMRVRHYDKLRLDTK